MDTQKPKKEQKPQPKPNRKVDWNNDLRKVGDHLKTAALDLYFMPAELARKKFNDREVLAGVFLSHSNIVVRDGRMTSLRAFAEYEAAAEAVKALETAAKISGADLTAAIQVQQSKLAEAGERLDQAINTPGSVDLWKHVIGENGYIIVEIGDPELDVDPALSIQGCEVNLSIVPGATDKWHLGTVRYAGDAVPTHTHFALDQAGDSRLVQFVAVCGKLKGQEIKEKISLLMSLRRGKYDASGLVARHLEVRNADGLSVSADRTYMALPAEDLDLVQRFLAGHVAPEKPAVAKSDEHLAANTLADAMAEKGITPEQFAGAEPVADTPEEIPEALPADDPNPVTDEAEQADPANDKGPSDLPAQVERGQKRVTARQAATGVKPRAKRASSGRGKPCGKGDEE